MDRLSRPTLLVFVALGAAFLAREATLRHGQPAPSAETSDESAPSYPPRLLELPEGVVPVALNFAPPPLTPYASGRQTALPQPGRLFDGPPLDVQRLPPANVPPANPPAMPSQQMIPEGALEPAAPAPARTSDSWIVPQRETPDEEITEETTIGPELAPPQAESSTSQRSVLVHEPPAGPEPQPAAAPIPELSGQPDALVTIDLQARRTVDYAFFVAQRGATYTARAELVEALRMIAQSLDAAQGTGAHAESLAAAFRALEEGEAFQTRGARPDLGLNLKNLVGGHRTPVLKDADLARLTPLQAMQQYYTFAQEQFAAAGERRPAASLALYGLGKLHMVMAEKPGAGAAMDLPKAMVYHQAAMLVDPQNHLAANELGVLLARFEQWEEAKRVLLQSVAVNPLPQTWHNLAVVHDRLGETTLATQARFESEQLRRQNPAAATAGAGPNVRWLSADEFAATGERPTAAPASAPPAPLKTSQEMQPGGIELLKPWTWF
jgi:tetratricopeptide (TPR) repeat protein